MSSNDRVTAAAPAPDSTDGPTSFGDGRYEVRATLGIGGKRAVYHAYDPLHERDVAIALVREGLDVPDRERVAREVATVKQLGAHLSLVTIHELGWEDSRPYIVMERMAQGSVAELLARSAGPLPLDRTLAIAICDALTFVHGHGLVHRDLRPASVFLTSDGVAKVGDFGLASALDRARLKLGSSSVRTATYMPPEQALGEAATPQSDLYSLGAMLYEMVTGRPPFPGEHATAVISQHLNATPVAPSWDTDRCPSALEQLILQLLEKVPANRPASAAEVREALGQIDPGERSASRPDSERGSLAQISRHVFVGREREFERLRVAVDAAFDGNGSLVMVVGEPGIGKTRLVQQIETYARVRGAEVLWGRARGSDGPPAYWPWVEISNHWVASRTTEEVSAIGREMPRGTAGELSRMIPWLRERVPPPPIADEGVARFRLIEAYRSFVRAQAAQSPLVLVLDDLDRVDKASLLLLQFMAEQLSRMRVLIVCTYRESGLSRTHSLTESLAVLSRGTGFERVPLRALSRDDSTDLIRTAAHIEPSSAALDRIYEATEGHPFFLSELVKLMTQEETLRNDVPSDLAVPDSLRETLGRRLDALADEANHALRISAVIGREFTHDTLTVLDGRSDDEERLLLEGAIEARIIEPPTDDGHYRFTHELVREALLAEISEADSARIHGEVGDALERRRGAALADQRSAQLAEHFVAAAVASSEYAAKAARYSSIAAREAQATTAWDEAIRYYEDCLTHLPSADAELQADEVRLLTALGRCQVSALREPEAAWQTLQRAFQLAEEQALPDEVATIGELVGMTVEFLAPRQLELVRRAIEFVDDGSHVAMVGRLHAVYGYSLGFQGDYQHAAAAFIRATAIAVETGDAQAELQALQFRATIDQFHFVSNRSDYERATELARGLGLIEAEAAARTGVA